MDHTMGSDTDSLLGPSFHDRYSHGDVSPSGVLFGAGEWLVHVNASITISNAKPRDRSQGKR